MALGSELAPFFGAAGAAAGGGAVAERSLRFNSADSAYLSRTFGSGGNRKKWTWSGWVKFTGLPAEAGQTNIFGAYGSGTATTYHRLFIYEDKLYFSNGSNDFTTRQVFRDYSAWYHIVLAFDTTQTDAADREIFYINGVRVDTVADSTLSFDTEYGINNASLHNLGRIDLPSPRYSNIYLADVYFLDGIAPGTTTRVVNGVTEEILTDFGEFDATTGVWNPTVYTGSYGTTGFRLDFADNSSKDALGYDAAGSNDWDVYNISVTDGSGLSYITGSTLNTPINAFDGSTSTSAVIDTTTRVLTNQSISVSSQFEIYSNNFDLQTISLISGGNTYQIQKHPTNNYTVLNNADSQNNTPFTGTLTGPISIVRSSGSASLYAVRVDGTVLVDSSITSDSLRDSPTNGDPADDTGLGGEIPGNYCTLNPLALFSTGNNYAPTNGNLEIVMPSAGATRATFAVSSGKFYIEMVMTAAVSTADVRFGILLASETASDIGSTAGGYVYTASGLKYNNSSAVSYGDSWGVNDVIGCAIDLDNGKIWWSKNGTWQASGDPASGTNAAYTSVSGLFTVAAVNGNSSSKTFVFNFGQRPFAYSAPSGFKALCTANLDDPTIEDPSTVMDVALWTGTGASKTITLGFNPDFVWIKDRGNATDHTLLDVIRGGQIGLFSNLARNDRDISSFNAGITSFNPNGFTLGADNGGFTNFNNYSYVGWAWDAGTSNATNTSGTITSTVRANPSAGFSVVTYTGTYTASTVGHGLGVAPQMIIIKDRTYGYNWQVYHHSIGNSNGLLLNTTDAAQALSSWNNTSPTSSVFSLGAVLGVNNSGAGHVAYCFAPVEGYSAFGSYTGNGSIDGTFVYTGFRPRWVLLKNSTSAYSWYLYDTKRVTGNAVYNVMVPNAQNGDTIDLDYSIDIVSNGFKCRTLNIRSNASVNTYVYAAFSENPFKYARAR
jgi:hypothetical protein